MYPSRSPTWSRSCDCDSRIAESQRQPVAECRLVGARQVVKDAAAHLLPSTGSGHALVRTVGRRLGFLARRASADPVYVGVFGADGIVFEADGIPHLVEQFFGSWFHPAFSGGRQVVIFMP